MASDGVPLLPLALPAMPPSVSALVFFVRDLGRTESFYRDVLGLACERMAGCDGPYLTAQAGALALMFLPHEEPPGRSPVVVFGLGGGIEDAVGALARQNVEIVVPVALRLDGKLWADFHDPDGHVLSLTQPADAPRRTL